MKKGSTFWVKWLRWDLAAVLAGLLALIIYVGMTFAQVSGAKFDFGSLVAGNVAGGYTGVTADSIYPVTGANGVSYGWQSGAGLTDVLEADTTLGLSRLNRDSVVGVNQSVFRVTGLTPGTYGVSVTGGLQDSAVSTRVTVGSLVTNISTSAGAWQTRSLVVSSNGNIEITLSGPSGGSWAVSAIDIVRSSSQLTPDFELVTIPSGGTVAAGGIIQLKVSITSLNGFSDAVDVEFGNLPTGVTATPSQWTTTVLPMTKTISLKVAQPVEPKGYALQVKGSDTVGGTSHSAVYNLNVLPAGSVITEPTNPTNPDTNTPTTTIGTVIVAPELKPDFKKIDSFVASQEQNAVGAFDLRSLASLTDVLSAVDIIPSFEPPKTTVGVVLQLMVQSGIINAAVSNGPPNGPFPKPKPQNWFQKAIGGIFTPAS